jgi:hypothetical protein
MQRNYLIAVVAGVFLIGTGFVAERAHAVSVSPNGIGGVLLYPYYTVNKGQDTLVSLVNTDSVHSKVVKVRFKEGYNGRVVMDLDVFLAPQDVWTAVVTQASDNAGALIRTLDESCTLPTIPAGGLAFYSAGYDGTSQPADDGPQNITRTREGEIEMITSGDVAVGTPTLAAIVRQYSSTTFTSEPPLCGRLTAADIAADVTAPSDSLFGSASIVNVRAGIFFGYAATAIRNFTAKPLFDANDVGPTLDQANTSGIDGARAYVPIEGAELPLAADFSAGIDAVSAVLTTAAIEDEYIVDPALGAATDWIITYPTKSWYVDKMLYPQNATTPFVEPFRDGASRVTLEATAFDRETGYFSPFCGVPPPGGCGPAPPVTRYQVNAVSVRAGVPGPPPLRTSDVFGSALYSSILPYTSTGLAYSSAGWIQADLSSGDGGHVIHAGHSILAGLPAIGFMAYNIVNTNAQSGLLANYIGVFPHHTYGSRCQTTAQGACTAIGD